MTDTANTFARHQFRVMGCDAEVLIRMPEAEAAPLFEVAEAELRRLEAMMTRFDPTSELERLNDAGRGKVSPELRRVLSAARAGYHATDGRFDIGIGADLIAAGYDRTFDQLAKPARGRRATASRAAAAADPFRFGRVAQQARQESFTIAQDGMVRISPGVRLDVGGIGKGWSADFVAGLLSTHKVSCLVNVGGDIALRVMPGDEPWPIGVQVGDNSVSIAVAYGGVATSGQDKRVWYANGQDGATNHHVIDPATRRSATTDVLRITVMHEACALAEVWSKALMLSGYDAAVRKATEQNLTTVILGMSGGVRYTGSLDVLNRAA